MAYTKEAAIGILFTGAAKYEQHLCNKNLLFVCSDKLSNISFFEVSFDASNFQHLTGVSLKNNALTPLDFYQHCLDRRLSVSDIEFASNGTTQLKLEILSYIVCPHLHASMMGDYNSRGQVLYTEKLAGGVKGGIGFVHTDNEKRYVPNTLLNGDMRNYMDNHRRILATFRKNKMEDVYSERVYLAKGVLLSNVSFPNQYAYLKNIQ